METCICNSLGRSEPRMASLDLSGEYTPSRKILHGQCAFFQDDQRSGGDWKALKGCPVVDFGHRCWKVSPVVAVCLILWCHWDGVKETYKRPFHFMGRSMVSCSFLMLSVQPIHWWWNDSFRFIEFVLWRQLDPPITSLAKLFDNPYKENNIVYATMKAPASHEQIQKKILDNVFSFHSSIASP